MRGLELPVALLNTTSPLVAGNRGADMVRANSFARGGNFLLGLAGCQGKDLIGEAGTQCGVVTFLPVRSLGA